MPASTSRRPGHSTAAPCRYLRTPPPVKMASAMQLRPVRSVTLSQEGMGGGHAGPQPWRLPPFSMLRCPCDGCQVSCNDPAITWDQLTWCLREQVCCRRCGDGGGISSCSPPAPGALGQPVPGPWGCGRAGTPTWPVLCCRRRGAPSWGHALLTPAPPPRCDAAEVPDGAAGLAS